MYAVPWNVPLRATTARHAATTRLTCSGYSEGVVLAGVTCMLSRRVIAPVAGFTCTRSAISPKLPTMASPDMPPATVENVTGYVPGENQVSVHVYWPRARPFAWLYVNGVERPGAK